MKWLRHMGPHGTALVRLFLAVFAVMAVEIQAGAAARVDNLNLRTSLEGAWKICVADDPAFADAYYDDTSWDTFTLPGIMLNYAKSKNGRLTGVLWIRKSVFINEKIPRGDIGLILGRIANADETYFNGVRIDGTGKFPPHEFAMWYHPRHYTIPEPLIRYGDTNVIAVRIWYNVFAEVQGDLAITNMKEWRTDKALNEFFLITVCYIAIAAGLTIFLIFFLLYVRRRSSQEYLFYFLQLLCGFFVILEICDFWDTYGGSYWRFFILSASWLALNVMHPIFLHRIYELQRKKVEIMLWIYLALVVAGYLFLVNESTIQPLGILMIIGTNGVGFYNFSCHFSALYKKKPYAKLFSFFGGFVVITAIHDGIIYLFKFIGYNIDLGILFEFMLFPYGAIVLYVGTSLVMVSRFIGMIDEIRDVNENLELKVRERTRELKEARDALWGEMELAKKIQTVLLPRSPSLAGYELSTYINPAKEVGGDYYDIINAAGRDWLVIGDVSGHGVPAGLIMMMVQTSLHTIVRKFPNIRPSELLSIINSAIRYNMRQMEEEKYMSIAVFAVFQDGRLYCSGVHQDIMIYRAAGDSVEVIVTEGSLLGIQDDIKNKMADKLIELGPNDCMMIYTDGITEAWRKGSVKERRAPERDMYGEEKLREMLRSRGRRSPDEIRNGIVESLADYECKDDVTLVIVKRLVNGAFSGSSANVLRA